MNQKTRIATALLLAAGTSMAQATTYDVSATFSDGGMQGVTVFNGSFNWDGSTVSDFTGLLSESMWGWNSSRSGGVFDSNGTAAGGMSAAGYEGNVYSQTYTDNQAPLLNLTYDLATSVEGNLVTVTAFLQNTTNAVSGGGYDVVSTDNATTYGNDNAFFTLVFDSSNITNTTATVNDIVYGDFTALGLMGPMLTGSMGMTGYYGVTNGGGNGGSMGGIPAALSITAASDPTPVPEPGAIWLFGSAMLGMFGAKRRKPAIAA